MRPAGEGDDASVDVRPRGRWARALPACAGASVAALVLGAMQLAGMGDLRLETGADSLSVPAPLVAAMLSALCAALVLLALGIHALKSANRRLDACVEELTDRANTERALAEARDQAEAANRAKSRFLAMVSHEIRTPLNGILGMADLMLDTPLVPEQATYVQAVKTSGDTLLALIDEMLDFSKIEAGKLDLEARPFGLATLVEEMVELLAPRVQAKGLEIASYLDERLPERMIGDAARLRQVLLNLAGNAVKFTEAGGVAVIVEPGIWPEDVSFTLRDTGIGVAADAQARIFLEFEQADDGPTRRFGGTGLGLAITKRIVERMGGRIALASTPGAGSSFHFPVTLPSAADGGQAFSPPRLNGASVLIVAPSAIEAPLIARRLGRWGARTCIGPGREDRGRALA